MESQENISLSYLFLVFEEKPWKQTRNALIVGQFDIWSREESTWRRNDQRASHVTIGDQRHAQHAFDQGGVNTCRDRIWNALKKCSAISFNPSFYGNNHYLQKSSALKLLNATVEESLLKSFNLFCLLKISCIFATFYGTLYYFSLFHSLEQNL